MTKVGGYWREAATLIVAAKGSRSSKNLIHKQQSSSVSLTDSLTTRGYDYKILMMKRSKKNKFLPENYVFPGGTLSEADFDPKWINIFEDYIGHDFAKYAQKRFVERELMPMMFVNRPKSLLPAQVAFRICAIRECFEECGLLFVKRSTDQFKEHEFGYHIESSDLNRSNWRSLIHHDPKQFILMCTENKLIPDIWALHEWSNWLTPTMGPSLKEPPKKPHRFDTMFYICCTDKFTENIRIDKREAVTAQWQSPGLLISEHQKGVREMIGPQLYELSRLCNFSSIDKLKEFASNREVLGLPRWMPVLWWTSDGIITLLPGDESYPKDPDYNGNKEALVSSETMDEIAAKSVLMNRSQRRMSDKWEVVCNIEQTCGHVMPVAKIILGEGKL